MPKVTSDQLRNVLAGNYVAVMDRRPAVLAEALANLESGGLSLRAVTTLSSSLGNGPHGIAYDGQRIWTANDSGSVSIITLNPTSVTTVSTGFNSLNGVIYDGANIWVTDDISGSVDKLRKLDCSSKVTTVTMRETELSFAT